MYYVLYIETYKYFVLCTYCTVCLGAKYSVRASPQGSTLVLAVRSTCTASYLCTSTMAAPCPSWCGYQASARARRLEASMAANDELQKDSAALGPTLATERYAVCPESTSARGCWAARSREEAPRDAARRHTVRSKSTQGLIQSTSTTSCTCMDRQTSDSLMVREATIGHVPPHDAARHCVQINFTGDSHLDLVPSGTGGTQKLPEGQGGGKGEGECSQPVACSQWEHQMSLHLLRLLHPAPPTEDKLEKGFG